jgi:hypothetical protein
MKFATFCSIAEKYEQATWKDVIEEKERCVEGLLSHMMVLKGCKVEFVKMIYL